MATASFERKFVVTDRDSCKVVRSELSKPIKVSTPNRNYTCDSEKGIALLKLRLSNSQKL